MDLLKNLNNMITAEEFYKQTTGCVINHIDIKNAMIEFAKLHVKEALKDASENFKMKIKDDVHELDMNDDWMEVDKDSIINVYSLEKIK